MNHSLKILLWKEKKGKKLKKPTLLFFSFLVKDYSALRAKKQPSTKGNISLTPSTAVMLIFFLLQHHAFFAFSSHNKKQLNASAMRKKTPENFSFRHSLAKRKNFSPIVFFLHFFLLWRGKFRARLKEQKNRPIGGFLKLFFLKKFKNNRHCFGLTTTSCFLNFS